MYACTFVMFPSESLARKSRAHYSLVVNEVSYSGVWVLVRLNAEIPVGWDAGL